MKKLLVAVGILIILGGYQNAGAMSNSVATTLSKKDNINDKNYSAIKSAEKIKINNSMGNNIEYFDTISKSRFKIEKNTGRISMSQNNLDYSINPRGDFEFKSISNNSVIFRDEKNKLTLKEELLDGGFRLLYKIESENSSKKFKIDLDLPEDTVLSISDNEGVNIVDKSGKVKFFIGKPWAVDNKGNFIDTKYIIENNSLYQIVNYNGNDYPLVADPPFCNDTVNNTETKWNSKYTYTMKKKKYKGTMNVVVRGCTKTYITATFILGPNLTSFFIGQAIEAAVWKETSADASFKPHVTSKQRGSFRKQLACHLINPISLWKNPYHIEPNRPEKSLLNTYKEACNPK